MAEPKTEATEQTEATELSLRAAEVATEATETDLPQERRRLMTAFTRAATSGTRPG